MGVAVYQKKFEFGSAEIEWDDVVWEKVEQKYLIEENSVVIDDGQQMLGREKEVGRRFL